VIVFVVQKTAVAVAFVKKGVGRVKINGVPIELVEPEVLRYKVPLHPDPCCKLLRNFVE